MSVICNCACDCFNCGRSAFCRACDKLLTWSEPNEAGDIKAGLFTVEKSAHWKRPDVSVFTALLPMEHIGKFADQESAKLACERHARKMLGWDK